ncbi:MAG: hypothetical protein ABI325_02910 [Ginsengibacter sp.]
MNEFTTIPKNIILPPDQDYEFLRSEGLKHIENLASEVWTDYNAHDPGITILEALCYAITELGYRCGFDIKDFLRNEDGTLVNDQALYTAKEILTINPLTINDYRKLLIDIKGVHNAWLIADDVQYDEKKNQLPVNEVAVYADCENDQLTLIKNTNPLYLSGLYRVLLDLDFDDRFGDLNNGEIVFENPATEKFAQGEFFFSLELPSWKNADFNFPQNAGIETNIDSAVIVKKEQGWECMLTLVDISNLVFHISISKAPSSNTVDDSDVQEMFNNKKFISLVFKSYFEKIFLARNIVFLAGKSLQEHRNFCEDFISVTTIDDEEIAFCFDVDVNASADIEKIEAEIFYAIDNYLNPSVDFYSLKELLNKNIPVDEIFTGPILQHGFVDTEQLEHTTLRNIIHTSDIINLLMDIEGVQAIRNFLMTKYDGDGNKVAGSISEKWCMDISPWHKPVLSTDKSKIILFKNQFPFLSKYDEVRDTVLVLHAIHSKAKLNGLEDDLPVPEGSKRDTESHWPLQYDFPQTYGIGQSGLPSNASEQRIAQQLQLKAYLMFYEQLLADFFSQLTNADKLFSVAPITQTYFAQFLKDIKDIEKVYSTASATIENSIAIPDATTDLKNGWQQLYESKQIFEDRRNRFLDHLLSRFAESFNDYALLMFRINYEDKTQEKIEFKELTGAKINTLKYYPVISSERGKAFNYFPENYGPLTQVFTIDSTKLWDTDNVSGLEKRISFLTGITDVSRRFLYCIKNVEIICGEELVEVEGEEILKCFHTFSLVSLEGIKMNSLKYETKDAAIVAVNDAITLGADLDLSNYLFDITLQLIGHSNEILLESEAIFNDKPSSMEVAEKLATELSKDCNDPMGLHLIEHILLRPRPVNMGDQDFDLMEVCLHDCDCLCEMDPYTFRASVVLPYWPGHFDNMDFRNYFENKIREEAPAHVMLKICWLNNELMREFEVRYKSWIEALAAYSFDRVANLDTFKIANNLMIDILKKLHSEYPLATLHDCDESKEGSNTVILGKTVLGTFKN